MARSGRISWRDIVGEVSIYFCDSDWDTVRSLVLETGMNPIGRCNAACADFDLREDFDALTNAHTERQNHERKEAEMRQTARATLAAFERDGSPEDRDLVEARVTQWTLEDLREDGTGNRQRG
jgi:hypothetical protein